MKNGLLQPGVSGETDKKVIVHDFSHETTFPPKGYGGIERWLWTVAQESVNLGFEVVLAGPLWIPDTIKGNIHHFKERITNVTKGQFLDNVGKCDYLVGGHEFFGKPQWDKPFQEVAETMLTYQHRTEPYPNIVYDRKRFNLFCYSEEMMQRYADQKPYKLLHGSYSCDEEPVQNLPEKYVLWIGRIDYDKALHLASSVPEVCGMPLVVMAPHDSNNPYFQEFHNELSKDSIHFIGEKSGRKKMDIISKASCVVYTLAEQYIEAGVLILGEVLRCGVPVAGITWKGNDCAPEAIEENSGKVIRVDSSMSVADISEALGLAVSDCLLLDRSEIAKKNLYKFDPTRLTKEMYELASQ